ncbi:MFS transporter [Alicyclobacillus sp.]|uniref:MFS transporter n=1 Tax=Alicyclobacillus sp. TaxID=61169 RepID=UPI0025BA765B|nr:MFS transporter [Alicyclobacillus sp.]MCL6516272.1 MFS transporter [Alicyclobacillus sp.]
MSRSRIWNNRDFRWLISGQTVSEFGSAVSGFALPWLMLQMTGSALQMGLSFAVGFVPYLLLSLPAGVWADQWDRKRMMVLADGLRMALIATIPAASLAGVLTVAQLYIVMAGMSACNALFDAAYVSCLPNVVDRSELQEANAALQGTVSVSQILGPALAMGLIGFVGAANTLVLDALSYLVSVVSLLSIRRPFSAHSTGRMEQGMLRNILEGLRYVWNQRLIRTISLFTLVGNLGGSAASALVLYRLHHDLHASVYLSGLAMAGFSAGSVLGSFLSGFLSRRMQPGRLMAASLFLFSIPDLVTAAARSPLVIGLANVLMGVSIVLWNVQSVSLRQSVIPDHMLGRASSSIRMLVWCSIPLGNAMGGVAGEWFGTVAVFTATGLMHLLVWLAGFRTPLYRWSRTTFDSPAARTPASG